MVSSKHSQAQDSLSNPAKLSIISRLKYSTHLISKYRPSNFIKFKVRLLNFKIHSWNISQTFFLFLTGKDLMTIDLDWSKGICCLTPQVKLNMIVQIECHSKYVTFLEANSILALSRLVKDHSLQETISMVLFFKAETQIYSQLMCSMKSKWVKLTFWSSENRCRYLS